MRLRRTWRVLRVHGPARAADGAVSVFITYTRESGPQDARRLAHDLGGRLGAEQLGPEDVPREPGGSSDPVGRCDLLVAVIGPGWQGLEDEFAGDVEAALARRIPVIPVLTRDAVLPSPESLPGGLGR